MTIFAVSLSTPFLPTAWLPPQVAHSPFSEATLGTASVCFGEGMVSTQHFFLSASFILILCSSTGFLQAAVHSGISIYSGMESSISPNIGICSPVEHHLLFKKDLGAFATVFPFFFGPLFYCLSDFFPLS